MLIRSTLIGASLGLNVFEIEPSKALVYDGAPALTTCSFSVSIDAEKSFDLSSYVSSKIESRVSLLVFVCSIS